MVPFIPSENTPDASVTMRASASLRSPQVIVSTGSKSLPPPDPDREMLVLARERFRKICSTESDWRRRAEEEFDFVDNLEHWTPAMKAERIGRPCLTFDRIGPSVDQVLNNARRSPPEPKISPTGGGATKWTAEILQGLIRNIRYDSSATIASMTAYEHAVKVGRGWWRVHFDYENEESFEQKIIIKRVANPFSVYPDPAAEEWDYSDMRYCFVTEDLDSDLFKELYPEASAAPGAEFEGANDPIKDDWFPNNAIRVAEYWWVKTEQRDSVMLANGQAVDASKAPDGVEIIGRRKAQRRNVYVAKITGNEVLEKWEWRGKWIPIIPVLGREGIAKGKRKLRGMIRPAMDANLSYDYMRSKEAEAIGLAPISQWLVAAGQIEGFERIWDQANKNAFSHLPYKPIDINGQAVPPPIRVNAEPAVAAISNAIAHDDNDIKASLATWDASLGRPGPEFSGKAINLQQQAGDNAHFHFFDNLNRSEVHTAKVIIDLAPHVYSEARALTITDPDGSDKEVLINQEVVIEGQKKIYDIANPATRYAVTIGNGQSYASRRQAGADALMNLSQGNPLIMQRAADLVVKSLDIPGGDEIADRLRPPDVQTAQEGQTPIPPQVQQQMAQAGQMVEALTAKVNELTELVRTKQIEAESSERIAAMNNEVKIVLAQIKAEADAGRQVLAAELGEIRERLKLLHADRTVEEDAAGQAAQPRGGPPVEQPPSVERQPA